MSVYYPGCSITIPDPECSDCPDKELAGMRSFFLVKETFAFVDITDPEFKIAKCDYIILSEILEHLVLPEKLLNKVRNSAPYLLISIPNSAFYKHRISLLFGRFFKQWAVHPAEHLRYWSHRDFLEWLEALDLKVIKYKASNGRPWPNLLGNQICYLVKT